VSLNYVCMFVKYVCQKPIWQTHAVCMFVCLSTRPVTIDRSHLNRMLNFSLYHVASVLKNSLLNLLSLSLKIYKHVLKLSCELRSLVHFLTSLSTFTCGGCLVGRLAVDWNRILNVKWFQLFDGGSLNDHLGVGRVLAVGRSLLNFLHNVHTG